MNAFFITSDGSAELQEVNKKYLSARFQLHSRDLRPVLLTRQLSTISVRGSAIVVNLEDIKMLIGEHEAYVLLSGHDRVTNEFKELLLERLQKNEEDTHTPFEFLLLESSLFFMLEKIELDFMNFERTLTKILFEITSRPTEELFEKLLALKKRLSRLEKLVQEIQDALEDLLEDEEEMSDLRLSSGTEELFPLEKIESIIDNALEQAIEVANKVSEKKENIDDTQEIMTLKMSSIRNTIIRLDLFTSVGTTILAFGTLVTGFYGMNVQNSWEESPWAFWAITGAVVILSVLFFSLFYAFLKKKNMPSLR